MIGSELSIWINAGEASGDMHGALLMQAFQQQAEQGMRPVRFTGMGGQAMREAGMQADISSEELSIMGFTEVFSALPRVARLLWKTYGLLRSRRPDVVVLIDSPEYNFIVARMARRLAIPAFYYISPQVWAWRRGRVRFLSSAMRRVLCILPFEEEFYRSHGGQATYVGHPLLDAVPLDELMQQQPHKEVVGILPGSRSKEVSALLPEFAAAARNLAALRPGLQFRLFRAPGVDAAMLRSLWQADISMHMIEPECRYAGMRECSCLLAASGTVTLEAALIGTPTVVAYKVSPLTYALGKRLIRVDHISLPNLIMSRRVFPELLQHEATADSMSAIVGQWLDNPEKLQAVRDDLAQLRSKMGEPGAAARAARLIREDVGE